MIVLKFSKNFLYFLNKNYFFFHATISLQVIKSIAIRTNKIFSHQLKILSQSIEMEILYFIIFFFSFLSFSLSQLFVIFWWVIMVAIFLVISLSWWWRQFPLCRVSDSTWKFLIWDYIFFSTRLKAAYFFVKYILKGLFFLSFDSDTF